MSAREVARYAYQRADGSVLAWKVRYEPKDFRWLTPTPNGAPVAGLNGQSQRDLPLYRLPDVLNAAPDALVFHAEGEKDADNLAGLGVVGTTCPEGAGATSWPDARWMPLRGRHVVIVPDNDDAGRTHAERVAASLTGVAASVRVLALPGLPEKGDVSDWIASGGTREALQTLADAAPVIAWTEQEDAPRPGAELADSVFAAIKRFVVVSDDAARALALWVMHCHAFDAAEFTPYIQITSPTRESGKTTLIDVLEALVPEPLRADSATAAAIYRSVDRGRGLGKESGRPPVLFLDELDAVFGNGAGKSDKAEAVRGVLNSGFRSTGKTLVCDGDSNEPRAFVTFCPKVLAAIGACIPDTVTSRSIPIPLARATREELARLQPARARALQSLSEQLGEDLAQWAAAALPNLQRRAEPVLGLKARHDDVWGPLLNIAEELGGTWPQRARESARALHADSGDTTDGRDPGIAALADVRDLFDSDGTPFIASARMAELLRAMEGRPWAEYRHGQPITVHGIARLLRPFGIQPRQERIGYEKVRAYFRDDCTEAFRRYLPPSPAANGTTGTTSPLPSGNACPDHVPSGRALATEAGALTPIVPTVPLVPIQAGGMPFSWNPDPEGAEPVPF